MATYGRSLRRGLPRTPGGDPWPPAGAMDAATPAVTHAPVAEHTPIVEPTPVVERVETTPAPRGAQGAALRRGLPRAPGGEPWPPVGFAPAAAPPPPAASPTGRRTGLPRPGAAPAASVPPPAPVVAPPPPVVKALPPLPFHPSVSGGIAAATWQADRTRTVDAGAAPLVAPEPARLGPFTLVQWAGAAIVGVAGLVVAAGMVVLLTRWFLSLEFMRAFLTAYPGSYALPPSAPVGFSAWVNWQHFLNIFFMVLVIRSGLMVRHQRRPPAYWSPRGDPKRKVSIWVWFHQSLDILWIVNGVLFVILLFSTGQWMRLVPTSWDVVPNAVSAGLQYVSLDWPHEDGWVNYNSLQQLAYFAIVFLAAPLAAITGVRMSGVWPKNATRLNRIYPVEWARAVHYPTMLFFVLFIVGHVTLVLTTGALHNLNSMFAANGGDTWLGFWLFVLAMVVVGAGWVAARPLVLAPIAGLFGRVSER